MNYLDQIEVAWNSSGTLIDNFGQSHSSNQHNIEQQELNLVFTQKKAKLSDIVNGLMGVMGLEIVGGSAYWQKIMIAVFTIAIISPVNIHFFKHPIAKEILDLIDSEYGDHFLDITKLEKLYTEKPEAKMVVNSFIRKNFLEEEQDGRLYFVSNVIKNFQIG